MFYGRTEQNAKLLYYILHNLQNFKEQIRIKYSELNDNIPFVNVIGRNQLNAMNEIVIQNICHFNPK
jgi:hypothetical protein